MPKNELNVLYAFDNNYAPFGGTSIFSLLENNKGIERIRIFAVMDNVSDENRRRLEKTVSDYGRELIIVDGAEFATLMEQLGVPMYRGSYATHYRKFFQLFLPDDVERLLYIDSDSVVLGDLSDLINLDFQGKCVAVVEDAFGGRYKKLLGFKTDEIYFNAGVTFIDTVAWKERDYSNKLVDYIKNVRAKFVNPDQDLFNMVLKNDTVLLPLEYNFMPAHRAYSDKAFFRCYPREGYYTEAEIEHARQNPKIIHAYRFLGEFPWHKGNYHPDNEIFDYYLRKSEWADYIKKPSNKGIIFKIEKMMYKCMPKGLFLFIFLKYTNKATKRKNEELKK